MTVDEILKILLAIIGFFAVYEFRSIKNAVKELSDNVTKIKESMNGNNVILREHGRRIDKMEEEHTDLKEKFYSLKTQQSS